MVLAAAAAGADLASATVTDPEAERGISIQPAGDNPWPTDGTSPTTGRSLDAVADEYFEDGFGGMALTGTYYPILVQHCGYAGGVNQGAPFYGTCADIYYEMAKSLAGHSRITMLFNDILPTYAGGSRSIRVGHLWIQQEWGSPFFFQGTQDSSEPGSNFNTNVNDWITMLSIPASSSNSTPWNEKVLFNGLAGSKQWLKYKYRFKGLSDACNVLWNIAGASANLLGERSYEDHNHTLKFGSLPEGGKDAGTVYVLFRDDSAKQVDEGGIFYFNSMFEYEEDEGVYYRYMIDDMDNPQNNAVLFTEQRISNETVKPSGNDGIESGNTLDGTLYQGEAITFANVIVQYIGMEWPSGERPYPIVTGTGNADYFMGGKCYSGVWQRNELSDRTVFYGEDGQEIALQPGRTMIVMMDYETSHRSVRYE